MHYNKEKYITIKSVNKSMFYYGINISVDSQDEFLDNIENKTIDLGKGKEITLVFEDYKLNCSVRNINKKDIKSRLIQIRYDGNRKFKEYLKNKFKYTYELLQNNNKPETDEYIEIYKGEEINTFYIKTYTHVKLDEEAQKFIDTIKNTKMSKSYKIPLFWAFYNDGNIKLKIDEDDIYKSFKNFYSKEENEIDLQGQKNTNNYKNWNKNDYIKFVKERPIKYLSEGTPEYFYREDNLFCISDKIEKYINKNEFKVEFKNVIEILENNYFKRELIIDKEEDITIDSNDLLDNINNYIKNQGYTYTKEQLSNLYLSLKTKPFVILAGISGTGKSKIVRLFANALGATSENNQFNLISVRPDWNDGCDLIGYKNLNDEFVEGQLTKIIIEASKEENKDKPYFVCLDEMNLARVEYYLSDYLSVIESRQKVGQEIITDKLVEYKNLYIPQNVYLIGTVNMDDTTFTFSRKVLDRANTIEFSDVDLENLFLDLDNEDIDYLNLNNDFLKTNYLKTLDIEEEYRDYAKEVNKKIVKINEILKKSKKQFAYRVRDEILFYMIENKKSDLLDENLAFDYQIMQKILPAINGSERGIATILVRLFNFICQEEVIDDIDIEEAENYLKNENVIYKNSAEKIIYMLKGYNDDGYVSYWY